jgi:hypothetical protein
MGLALPRFRFRSGIFENLTDEEVKQLEQIELLVEQLQFCFFVDDTVNGKQVVLCKDELDLDLSDFVEQWLHDTGLHPVEVEDSIWLPV